MARFVVLLRTASIAALASALLGGCAHDHEGAAPRRMSIKDDAADLAPPRPQRASYRPTPAKSGPVNRSASQEAPRPVVVAAPAVTKPPVAGATAPAVLPSPSPTPRPVVLEPAPAAVIEPPPGPRAVVPPEPPASTEPARAPDSSTPNPPRAPIVIVPAETRPTVEQRRQPAPPSTPSPAPAVAAKTEPVPPVSAPATVAAVSPPSFDVPAASTPSPAASQSEATKAAPPKLAALDEEQRIASVLTRADTYMKAGRYQDARTLLEDAVRNGQPRFIVALAETYDPLFLSEHHRRLSRTGDPERAIALYERAKAAGAKDLDARLHALKAAAGAKR